MFDYILDLSGKAVVSIPTAFGQTWATLCLSLLVAALILGVHGIFAWLGGVITQFRPRQEAVRFVKIWSVVLLAVFLWKFLEAAYSGDKEMRNLVEHLGTEVSNLTNQKNELLEQNGLLKGQYQESVRVEDGLRETIEILEEKVANERNKFATAERALTEQNEQLRIRGERPIIAVRRPVLAGDLNHRVIRFPFTNLGKALATVKRPQLAFSTDKGSKIGLRLPDELVFDVAPHAEKVIALEIPEVIYQNMSSGSEKGLLAAEMEYEGQFQEKYKLCYKAEYEGGKFNILREHC